MARLLALCGSRGREPADALVHERGEEGHVVRAGGVALEGAGDGECRAGGVAPEGGGAQ